MIGIRKIGLLILGMCWWREPRLVVLELKMQQLSNISICYNNNINFQMYKEPTTIQRQSRGTSRRAIGFVDNSKTSGQYYGSSIKKPTNYYQAGILKNSSKPVYESAIKTSVRDPNSRVYSYVPSSTIEKTKERDTKYGLISNIDSYENRADRDPRNQQFRIRSNLKDNMTNSRKTQKDEEERQQQRQKEMADSKRMQEQERLERQSQRLLKQKQKQKERQKQRQRERQREREREKQRQRQKQRQRLKRQSQIEQLLKKTDILDTKPTYSMNNSTTTGASDYSSSSLRNGGGSSYSFSTNTSKSIGLVGLNNIGNTCFMNSILQCMFNLPGFNDYFLTGKHEDQVKSGGRVAEAYARTVKMVRSSTSRSETPSQLKSAIGSKKSRFMGYSQQDAQQFLAALLELLSIDLNRARNPKYKQLTADLSKHSLKQISDEWWNYNKQRQDSVVCDYFSGQVLSRVVCSKCGNESIAFDNIWDMALNFSPNDEGDILKMIENFLKKETISDDYYCSKCKGLRPCERKIDFYRLPKILVFQLKRFSYGRYRKVKLNNRVRVETKLNLSSVISQSNHPSVKNPVYNLVGVVNHSGDIDFGHYTAQCRNPINGKWYDFNDSSVHQIKIRQQFESSSPYLLFYAKQDI